QQYAHFTLIAAFLRLSKGGFVWTTTHKEGVGTVEVESREAPPASTATGESRLELHLDRLELFERSVHPRVVELPDRQIEDLAKSRLREPTLCSELGVGRNDRLSAQRRDNRRARDGGPLVIHESIEEPSQTPPKPELHHKCKIEVVEGEADHRMRTLMALGSGNDRLACTRGSESTVEIVYLEWRPVSQVGNDLMTRRPLGIADTPHEASVLVDLVSTPDFASGDVHAAAPRVSSTAHSSSSLHG